MFTLCVCTFQIATGGGLWVRWWEHIQGLQLWDYSLEDVVRLSTLQAGHLLRGWCQSGEETEPVFTLLMTLFETHRHSPLFFGSVRKEASSGCPASACFPDTQMKRWEAAFTRHPLSWWDRHICSFMKWSCPGRCVPHEPESWWHTIGCHPLFWVSVCLGCPLSEAENHLEPMPTGKALAFGDLVCAVRVYFTCLRTLICICRIQQAASLCMLCFAASVSSQSWTVCAWRKCKQG